MFHAEPVEKNSRYNITTLKCQSDNMYIELYKRNNFTKQNEKLIPT